MEKVLASLTFKVLYYFDGILTTHKRKTAIMTLKEARRLKNLQIKNPSRIRDIQISVDIDIRNFFIIRTFTDENDNFNKFRHAFCR